MNTKTMTIIVERLRVEDGIPKYRARIDDCTRAGFEADSINAAIGGLVVVNQTLFGVVIPPVRPLVEDRER